MIASARVQASAREQGYRMFAVSYIWFSNEFQKARRGPISWRTSKDFHGALPPPTPEYVLDRELRGLPPHFADPRNNG